MTESTRQPNRPNIMGTRHVISAGHYLAAQAGFQVLEAGGNAIDAGVAAGITLGVVECEFVSFAGVAPIMIYLADRDEVLTISGLGTWPRAASCAYFRNNYGGAIPIGIPRTIVPAAADAWLTALADYGTLSFGDVAAAAIRLAEAGFAVDSLKADRLAMAEATLRSWPSSADIFLPGGRLLRPGDLLRQSDLAKTLRFLADEEAAHASSGRRAAVEAVRAAFYRGDVAATIVRFHRESGGLLTAEDMASFRVAVEPPVSARFGDMDVYACGPWCQGPMLLQALNLLEGIDLQALGHNSAAYLHVLAEAIKLAAADREAYYGDPRFVHVPLDVLLSKEYAAQRRTAIRPTEAWSQTPPGDVGGTLRHRRSAATGGDWSPSGPPGREDRMDTSYVCVTDRWGNVFSATPSDGCTSSPIVPGTGLVVSPRGSQSWTDPDHPSSIAPGKRPRLTPNPAIAIRPGRLMMPFGTPGGDSQVQVMLQVFLNILIFGMDPQSAVEVPRVATHSFPSSFEPHDDHPASLHLEGRMGADVGEALAALGHRISWWPSHGPENTSSDISAACTIVADLETGVMTGAADPRRPAYALGW